LESKQFSKAYSQFSESVKKTFSEKQLETAWNSIKPKFGTFIDFTKSLFYNTDTSATIILSCDFEKAFLDIKFMYNPADEITTFILPA